LVNITPRRLAMRFEPWTILYTWHNIFAWYSVSGSIFLAVEKHAW
jgi:hypothetical protein